MINITLVILISSAIFVVFKLFKRYKVDNFQAITINYLVASFFGILITDDKSQIFNSYSAAWFPYALISGIAFTVIFMLFALSSQKAGIAITAVFSKMSVIIPVIIGILLYNEQLNNLKIFGVVFTLFSFILIFYKKGKSKLAFNIIILPLLIFIITGLVDSLLKHAANNYIQDDTIAFLTVIFIVALIVGLLTSLIRYLFNKKVLQLKSIICGIILGFLNFGTTYFMLKAMAIFQSNVLFPIQNVGIVMVSALAGLFFFKEKLSFTNWLGIFLSVLAILTIAFA